MPKLSDAEAIAEAVELAEEYLPALVAAHAKHPDDKNVFEAMTEAANLVRFEYFEQVVNFVLGNNSSRETLDRHPGSPKKDNKKGGKNATASSRDSGHRPGRTDERRESEEGEEFDEESF